MSIPTLKDNNKIKKFLIRRKRFYLDESVEEINLREDDLYDSIEFQPWFNFPHLKYLYIGKIFVTFSPQFNFSNLKNLIGFSINDTLFDFKGQLRTLINLYYLDLTNTNLSKLPVGIEYLINLVYLDLSFNKLSYNEKFSPIWLLNLKYLSLEHNDKLKKIPFGFGNSLKFINLNGTGINKANFEKLALEYPKTYIKGTRYEFNTQVKNTLLTGGR